ncbi:hypothetical protein KOW79_001303 [Hemibagrus wyckioides]|uniref:Bcl-2 Bcl-2 homology region 1-3 domain-containing protein n=1 Tax=Hemibagrus wyckioides TaxID=337641 RepID=A0A9D3P558_9TELE|nr:hypothetical protein KOW79_001303 [Hemibagrus wyckioides]
MDDEGTADAQIGEALLFSMIQDQINTSRRGADISPPHLPEVQPFTNKQDQKLFAELGQTIRVISANTFSKLAQSVFSDGKINWGRIIVLFYAVGKLAAKKVLANLPTVFSEILEASLSYFRTKLLGWILSVGGWISSISALTQFSIDRTSASSLSIIPLPAALFITFFGGILLGGVIVWKVKTSS